MNLDHDLKRALGREKPSAGFARRVAAQCGPADPAAVRLPGRPRWRAIAAAIVVTAGIGGFATHRAIEYRREGERAREQVLQAMRIAGEKVRYAQEQVREVGAHETKP